MEENTTLTNPSVATAHDDFDWSIDKRNVARYNNDEQQKYDAVYEGTFKTITDGEMVQGTVVGMTKNRCGDQHWFQKRWTCFIE